MLEYVNSLSFHHHCYVAYLHALLANCISLQANKNSNMLKLECLTDDKATKLFLNIIHILMLNSSKYGP